MNIEKEADNIMDNFYNFTDGVRLLLLIHRGKEGGQNRDRKHKKKISKNRENFREILISYLEIMKTSDIPYRIYSCVNARNIDKAIREFKRVQLDADYYDTDSKQDFYIDINNRWISSLMKPKSRDETSFLIDVDEGDDLKEILDELIHITRNYFKYKTKNGWHIITQPFNPALLTIIKVKKDGLLLLKY